LRNYKIWDVSVGILFNHYYGYDSKSIYGCDKLPLDSLKRKGLEINMKPVAFLDGDHAQAKVQYCPKVGGKNSKITSFFK
jgi:hypothetical protein